MPHSHRPAVNSRISAIRDCVATATLMLTACGEKGPSAPPPVEVAAITVAAAAAVAEATSPRPKP